MAHRDAEIVRLYAAGDSLTIIGSRFGLSCERVRQIVKASGVVMPKERRCKVDECQTIPPWPQAYCRRHQRRLDRYGDPLGTRRSLPAPPREHGTYAAYRAGCRCDLCRSANAAHSRKLAHCVHPECATFQKGGGRLFGRRRRMPVGCRWYVDDIEPAHHPPRMPSGGITVRSARMPHR
jgi:hypothetical protein